MSEKGHFTIKPQRTIMQKEAILELMREGKVVAIDRKNGKYVNMAFGVHLSAPEECISKCACARKN